MLPIVACLYGCTVNAWSKMISDSRPYGWLSTRIRRSSFTTSRSLVNVWLSFRSVAIPAGNAAVYRATRVGLAIRPIRRQPPRRVRPLLAQNAAAPDPAALSDPLDGLPIGPPVDAREQLDGVRLAGQAPVGFDQAA